MPSELLCPECLGSLRLEKGNQVRCSVHGGTFQVLFARQPIPSNAPPVLDLGAPLPSPTSVPGNLQHANMRCVQHKSVAATAQCQVCGAYMCATCDFALPGGMHVCPSCAVGAQDKLSKKRRKALIISFALAAWSTLGMVAMLLGAFAGMVHNKSDESALGVALSLFVLIPSIIGMSYGLGAIDRCLKNPMILWVPTIWNGLYVAIFVILTIIGTFS